MYTSTGHASKDNSITLYFTFFFLIRNGPKKSTALYEKGGDGSMQLQGKSAILWTWGIPRNFLQVTHWEIQLDIAEEPPTTQYPLWHNSFWVIPLPMWFTLAWQKQISRFVKGSYKEGQQDVLLQKVDELI